MLIRIKFLRVCAVSMLGSAVLCACGTNTATMTDTTTPTNTSTTVTTAPASTTTTTTTTTTTSGWVASPNGTKGEFDVADNFAVNATLLVDSSALPVEADAVGAFRFECLSGQLAKDDPIVFPGQPGKSHLHQFFGNTATNASSTYQGLRTTGASTCASFDGSSDPTSQRSAYWMPAMLDGAGNAVKPNRMLTYYKRLPAGDSECGSAPDATHMGFCIPMPNGLRMITGYNMDTGTGGPADLTSNDQYMLSYGCWQANGGQIGGDAHTMANLVGNCPVGSWLRVKIDFPECWDGKNLDSPDHRSHVALATGAGLPSGKRACPLDHPYVIPQITMQAFFTVDANFAAGKWHLSSDEMLPGAAAGTTLHGDYWEAWSPVIKNLWETACIDAHKSCNNGQVGNSQKIKGMEPLSPYPDHVLVPLSSIQ